MDLNFLESILSDLSVLNLITMKWIVLVIKLTSKLNRGCTPGFALAVTRIITCWCLTRDDRIREALITAVKETIRENKDPVKYVEPLMFITIKMVHSLSWEKICSRISKTASFSAKFVIILLQRIKHREKEVEEIYWASRCCHDFPTNDLDCLVRYYMLLSNRSNRKQLVDVLIHCCEKIIGGNDVYEWVSNIVSFSESVLMADTDQLKLLDFTLSQVSKLPSATVFAAKITDCP